MSEEITSVVPATPSALTREDAIRNMKEHYVDVLMGQTTWSREEARKKLEANNYNVQTCVRIFMGLPAEKPNLAAIGNTTNQAIYGNIRGMMDEASRRYEHKKELEARIQSVRDVYQHTNQTQNQIQNQDS